MALKFLLLPLPRYNPLAIARGLAFCFFACLEDVPVYSEARLNKPVDGMLLGVGGAW